MTRWTVTELTTGFSTMATGKTRDAAIDALVTGGKIGAIREAVRMYAGPDVNAGVVPSSVIVSAAWRG